MADQKITQLTLKTQLDGSDRLVIVVDPTGTPDNRQISVNDVFADVQVNTSITGTFNTTGNTTFTNATYGPRITADHMIVGGATITSNNATTQWGDTGYNGAITWDENYIYVAVSNTVIKRAALSTFT